MGLATCHSLPASLNIAGFTASGVLFRAICTVLGAFAFATGVAVERLTLSDFVAAGLAMAEFAMD